MVQANFSLWGSSTFNTSYDTFVITHGYQSSSSADWVTDMAQAIKSLDSTSNIILTDWSDAADTFYYPSAVDDTIDVGNQLGNFLRDVGANPNTTQLIGHSLGAHISGIAADVYQDITGAEIELIVGLDPAGPEYEDGLFTSGAPTSERLDANDADQVVVLHTSETFGYDDRLGDLDLYLNWDDFNQPGEWNAVGNHSYAHQVYTELLEGYGHVQNNGLLGSVLDYEDLFSYTGIAFVDTTTNPIFVG
ncbi:MAG: hypothetical protein F6K58_20455 [Symploca sp. SIO2E9]|nr:hypothetical protein [Symploca sp. SIO2E9]